MGGGTEGEGENPEQTLLSMESNAGLDPVMPRT